MSNILSTYAEEVITLAPAETTAEESYYPAIKALISGLLRDRKLPGDVRVNTKERRGGGGLDRPDIAIYDGSGEFILVGCEGKLPTDDVTAIAMSIGQNNQVGRYLAKTKAVIVTNVRAFVLVTSPDWIESGPVPPERRILGNPVELWPSSISLKAGHSPDETQLEQLADLIEEAVTQYAPLAEPESVAKVLARQARRAKASLPEEFGLAVRGLSEDFGKALGITFEGEEGEEFFRSSLVQTVFYGLFAGWTLWQRAGAKGEFRWRDVADHLQIPFIGDLLHDIRQPTRLKDLGFAIYLDQAEATLERVDTARFFSRLEPTVLEEDAEVQSASAITYFYEPFLEAFDPELRKQLGVWYTPPEIVRYQVARVHLLLQDYLGYPLGLADDRVVILDPCCGTGAYLIETLQVIARTLREQGVGAEMGDKLREALTRRVIGFEILTAPFVVSHLQLYLLLQAMGAEPQKGERLAVYLTNALTGWDGRDQMKLNFPELQAEHDAVRDIKRKAEVIVVIGNPPYNRFAGSAIDEESDLVDHYKGIKRDTKGKQIGPSALFLKWKVRKQLLDDLYIRFFRLAEKRIGEKAKHGVVSFISNYSFLAGRSHPIMRESLCHNFRMIWVDSLNGDKYKTGKVIPNGLPGAGKTDQSIFTTDQDPRGIQVGTAITTLLKIANQPGPGEIYYRDLWGTANSKRELLLSDVIKEPYSGHRPTAARRWKFVPYDASGGYEDWPSLEELFPRKFQGVNPNRGVEGSLIDTDRTALEERMRAYYSEMPWAEFARRYPELAKNRARYSAEKVREDLTRGNTSTKSAYVDSRVCDYVLFPLDRRFIYYETEAKLLNERRPELGDNLEGNEFFVTVPEPRRRSETRPIIATSLFDLHLHERGSVGFPSFTTPTSDLGNLFAPPSEPVPVANILPSAWAALSKAFELSGEVAGSGAIAMTSKLFRLAIAIGHSPQFELENKENLSQDWMHLPIPKNGQLLDEIARLGDKVAVLLDPMRDAGDLLREILGDRQKQLAVLTVVTEGTRPDYSVSYSYFGGGKGRWNSRIAPSTEWPPSWGTLTGDLYLNPTTFLKNVPERIWHYELGGYPVIKKWLGYRDGKRRPDEPLTQGELGHLRSIVLRLAALHLLYEDLDELYESIGDDCFTAEELGLRTEVEG